MICEHCGEREATLQLTRTSQGKTTVQRLCADCAGELGIAAPAGSGIPFGAWFGQSLFGGSKPDIGSGTLHNAGGIPSFGVPGGRHDTVCPKCGLSFEAFRKSGLFGCAECYTAFADRLDAVFRRIQGGTRHVGRTLEAVPVHRAEAPAERLATLRAELKRAVSEEAYERAAKLRDEIKRLELPAGSAPGKEQP